MSLAAPDRRVVIIAADDSARITLALREHPPGDGTEIRLIDEKETLIQGELGQVDADIHFIGVDYSSLEDMTLIAFLAGRRGRSFDRLELAMRLCPPEPCGWEYIDPEPQYWSTPKPVRKMVQPPQQSFRSRMRSVNRNR